MILHKEDMFEKVAESTVYFDEVDVGQYFDPNPNRIPRTATTRLTKNIGLVVAFARKDGSPGCIVVTTHAFWHPKCVCKHSICKVIDSEYLGLSMSERGEKKSVKTCNL